MRGASDRPYCHWQRRIGPSSGDILNYSHTVRRLFSPCNCDVGRTPLTQLLHICLDILDEPLEKRKKKMINKKLKKQPDKTVEMSFEKLVRATADLSWTLVRAHRPRLVCWCGRKHSRRHLPPCRCRPRLSASKCGSNVQAARQTLRFWSGTALSTQRKSR